MGFSVSAPPGPRPGPDTSVGEKKFTEKKRANSSALQTATLRRSARIRSRDAPQAARVRAAPTSPPRPTPARDSNLGEDAGSASVSSSEDNSSPPSPWKPGKESEIGREESLVLFALKPVVSWSPRRKTSLGTIDLNSPMHDERVPSLPQALDEKASQNDEEKHAARGQMNPVKRLGKRHVPPSAEAKPRASKRRRRA
ncbi:hypothetical protein C8Q77DRAFT_331254 [Trametes polyzona]|nr:hypothetical protein C8Q77DRAFT_331254 [Trametes polyzona]